MSRRRERFTWFVLGAWCSVLVLFFYGRSLALPFFFDDFVHYPFVEANTIPEIWLETSELAYYRPVNFTIWRLTYELMQEHNPLLDHGINLALHALNSLLVGWLAARLWTSGAVRFPEVARVGVPVDWWRAFLSATLFLLYPFSYQAVPWVGSLSHLAVTSLILLSLSAYLQMRRSRRRIWGLGSLFFALLAPFAHENGVLVMPFIVLIELTAPDARGRVRRALRAAVVWGLPLLIYLPIWLSLPRLESGRLLANNLEAMLQNGAYFLQGSMYPLTGLGGWLSRTYGLNDVITVGLLSGAAILLALVVQLTQGATRRSWLPWLWCALASLPVIPFLVFDYVINGPRLLMVASVGATWLWVDVLLLFARGAKAGSSERLLRAGLAGGLALLLLWHNGRFVDQRMDLHVILGDGFKQIVDQVVRANEAGEEAVVINFPSWFAPHQATYALGHEGVLFWPDYVPPGILMATHTGQFGDLSFVRVDGLRPELDALYYGPTGPPPDWPALSAVPAQVFTTLYEPDRIALQPVGRFKVADPLRGQPLAIFGAASAEPQIRLHRAQFDKTPAGVRVDLVWEASAALEGRTMFVHLVGPDGQLLAQADGEPLGGSYPLELWEAGTIVQDTRWLPGVSVPGAMVKVGLYDRQSGERLAAFSAAGEPFADSAVPLPVANP